jgi:hypothetical protein
MRARPRDATAGADAVDAHAAGAGRMSDRGRSVRDMDSSPVDPAPHAGALRAADPRLREPLAGPLVRPQPSGLDEVREARFAAYRSRAEVRPPVAVPPRPTTRLDAATAEAWNARAAAYRARLGGARVPRSGSPADRAAEVSRRGAAAAREALRRHRQVAALP